MNGKKTSFLFSIEKIISKLLSRMEKNIFKKINIDFILYWGTESVRGGGGSSVTPDKTFYVNHLPSNDPRSTRALQVTT